MKIQKCKFEYDRWGLYLTPLIGLEWRKGSKRLWIGWLRWLFTIGLVREE